MAIARDGVSFDKFRLRAAEYLSTRAKAMVPEKDSEVQCTQNSEIVSPSDIMAIINLIDRQAVISARP